MRSWTQDNRWSPGGSGHAPPDEAPAAYAARWIDQGAMRADIVPDRQGFAYNMSADAEHLMVALTASQPHLHVGELPRDETVDLADYLTLPDGLRMFARRAGGYFYVDAWLEP